MVLAQAIQNENLLFENRGIKGVDNLAVLNSFSGNAAAYVEAGFLSNKNDLQILQTKSVEVGTGIAKGIIKYLEGQKQ